jgi:ribosomal protein S18 acetylase RimI-like enzyme
MGWHIFRHYNTGDRPRAPLNENIGPPDGTEIKLFLEKLSRPVSLLKEKTVNKRGLMSYLIDNAARSLYKGKSKCFIYRDGKEPAGFINVISDEICRKTLMTDKNIFKILDVIVLDRYKGKGIEAEMLRDIQSRLEEHCLLELWLEAENAELIEAAEDSGYHLSYSGAAFHYKKSD